MSESTISKFYEELKRRRVIRVATLYVVAIWPIIQLLDIISPTLNLPESVLRYLVIAFFSGLPFALILAWAFDLNKDGVHADDGEDHPSLLGSRTDLTIVGLLCVLVVALFFVQMGLEDDEVLATAALPQSPSVKVAGDLATSTALAPESTSIAVKPFDSFSVDPQDQFFADGLSEELLNVLAQVPELRVAARTSSFAYKGVNKNIRDIGRELNVANILEGSVRANDIDNTIRVTAQLIDVQSGQHLWSETYTHQYSDVFRIQDEISAAVAQKLKVTLTGNINKNGQSDVVRTTNPEALIAFGRGQQEISKRSEEGFEAAALYFQVAIDADPNFALAYAGLADASTLQASYGHGDIDSHLVRAGSAIDKALELDSQLGIAWASKGLLESYYPEKLEQAKASLEKAMALNPNYAMAVMWYASLEKDTAQKIRLYERAVELDPKAPVAAYNLARMYADEGREADVMRLFSLMVDADPNYPRGYELVGQISARNGQLGEAIVQFEKAFELGGDSKLALNIGKLYADLGEFDSSDTWFDGAMHLVPDEYRKRVLWLRIGRYMSAGDTETATRILEEIAAGPFDDLEAKYDQILANYYLGNSQNLVSLYEKAQSSGATFSHEDDYTADQVSFVLVAIADEMMSQGDVKGSTKLLDEAQRMIHLKLENPNRHWPEDRYGLARIAAIRGQNQQSLIQLQRAVDEGWREHWRAANDPAMRNLSSGQVFLTMMAGLENRLTIIREQLALEAEFAMGS